MEAAVITTYRCTNRCRMCNTWKHPSREEEEFRPSLLEKLPNLSFCNITGGEPFLRDDIGEIIHILAAKAKRVVISTNGYLTDRIVRVLKNTRQVGVRVSLEGLPSTNDALRGVKDGFDHGLRTLLELRRMGLKDIGIGITVSDGNVADLLELYELSKAMNLEFATAVVHNAHYFHKLDNRIEDVERVAGEFEKLALDLLKTKKPKNWFRAYFNVGLANKVRGGPRPLVCETGTDMFFLDPFGNVLPCNGMDQPAVMGNLQEASFKAIWKSDRAEQVRKEVRKCAKQCWMIGSASPAMKKRMLAPVGWILRNKAAIYIGKGHQKLRHSVGSLTG